MADFTKPRAPQAPATAAQLERADVATLSAALSSAPAAAPAAPRATAAPAVPSAARKTPQAEVPSGWSIAGAAPSTLTSDARPAKLPLVVPGYDPANLDKTVRPQDNFFQYAVGGYLATHPIPDDKSSWGVDAEAYQRVQNTLHDILESLPAGALFVDR